MKTLIQEKTKKNKFISITLIISIMLQIFMPIFSLATDYEASISTNSSGDILLKTTVTDIKEGDIVPIDVYYTGSKIIFFVGYLEYNSDDFEELTIDDVVLANTSWRIQPLILDSGDYQIEVDDPGRVTGITNGKIFTVNLKAKRDISETTVSMLDFTISTVDHGDDDNNDEGYSISLTFPEAAQTYTIKYYENKPDSSLIVSGMPTSDGTKVKGEDYIIAGEPSIAHYSFKGWNTKNDGSGTSYAAGATYRTDANLELYAQWEIDTATLTVNPNGGVWNGLSTVQTFTEGYGTRKTIANPTVTPNGNIIKYNVGTGTLTSGNLQETQTTTFNGWTGATLSGTTYTFGENDETLTAQYKANSVTLPTVSAPAGYTFSGWYNGNTRVGGNGESYTPAYTTSGTIITLTAKYSENTYTLTINPNGGTYSGNTTVTKGYGETETLGTINVPSGNTVTFNTNGGNTVTPKTQEVVFEKWTKADGTEFTGTTYTFGLTDETLTAQYTYKEITLPTATKTGANFLGWYDAATGGTKVGDAGDSYKPSANVTLYAQWEEIKYTLTINPNGGTYSGNTTVTKGYGETETLGTISVPSGNTVTFNTNGGNTVEPKTQEVVFEKWTKADGTDFTGTTYTFGLTDETLTAQYTYKEITLPTATKTGANFLGWYDAATGGTKVGDAGDSYKPSANVTLYAQWDEIEYTLTVNPNGGTYSGETTIKRGYNAEVTLSTPTAPNGYTITLDNNDGTGTQNTVNQTKSFNNWTVVSGNGSINGATYKFGTTDGEVKAEYTANEVTLLTPTRTGYDFEGWYDAKTGGTKIGEGGDNYNPSSNITLYAQWTAKTYTITFNSNGGDAVTPATKTVAYNQAYGTLPTPTRAGYEFEGWYNGETEVKETDIVNITTDITLIAKWTGRKYTVIFDAGENATINENSKEVTNGEQYGELPIPSKTGYTFKNWVNNNGEEITADTIVNIEDNITLYAQYEINKYTVTFKNADGTILETKIVNHGDSAEYTGNIPERTNLASGYKATFIGWKNASLLDNITKDITVIADYQISLVEYTITYYNLKGDENLSNPTKYTIDDDNIILKDLANQEKYIFKGWYTSNDENAEKVTSINTAKTGNIVLYAQWENDLLYFKSKKYKVGEKDIDKYEQDDIYLDKIEPKTTLAELIDNCDTNGKITVINEEGKTLSSGDLVGTNMTIKVTRYDEEITLTAVVMGDIDGDGKNTAQDLSEMNKTYLGISKNELTGARFKAADLDDNNKISATDFSELNKAILELIKLKYTKNK